MYQRGAMIGNPQLPQIFMASFPTLSGPVDVDNNKQNKKNNPVNQIKVHCSPLESRGARFPFRRDCCVRTDSFSPDAPRSFIDETLGLLIESGDLIEFRGVHSGLGVTFPKEPDQNFVAPLWGNLHHAVIKNPRTPN